METPEEPHVGDTGTGDGTAVDPDLVPAALTAAKHRGDYRRPLLRMADRAGAAAAELLALAVPVDCVCCGAEDLALCGGCERQVRLLTRTPFRAEAQAPALMDVDGSVLLAVVAAGAYRGELAQALLSFKSRGQGQLGDVLARGLARALRAAAEDAGGLVLVPVPTSGGAYRKRGFSPVHVLLGRLGRDSPEGAFSGFTVVDALRKAGPRAQTRPRAGAVTLSGRLSGSLSGRLRGTLTGTIAGTMAGTGAGPAGGQKGLGRGARGQRVRGSMRARGGLRPPDIRGRHCIIVDDVLTTGATLAEAARAVRAAGGLVRGAVVLAATRPPVATEFGAGGRTGAGATGGKEKNKPKKDE
ncbi:ComF family protein [Arthrobacter sp. CG_A4]|uniref:ComF family protein n=1 Tax=Arthrobacter sp. CG_A4 TaxID=3071706 RepID=UPI002DFC6B96|nr:putative amidophosphoribosyltransferase [Arthrobacter sp. CG_A4]